MSTGPNDGAYGQAGGNTDQSEYNSLRFAWEMFAQKMQTVTLVRVVAVTNDGDISPVGTVDVLPLVNQMTGNRVAVPHGVLYRVPYFRLQGGANAVIIDPQVGDIGMCAFASRDISAVKAGKAAAPPGSFRLFDWADGLYLGGFLNGTPTQYVVFATGGITLHSPTKITLNAPEVDIVASSKVQVTSPHITQSGDIVATGDVTGQGTSLHTHVHSGVQSGGSNSGPPV